MLRLSGRGRWRRARVVVVKMIMIVMIMMRRRVLVYLGVGDAVDGGLTYNELVFFGFGGWVFFRAVVGLRGCGAAVGYTPNVGRVDYLVL